MNHTPSSAWINYHHLYYFKTIAEEQSVSRAAKKLRLGQPTLSAQLKQFESAIGIKLFERQHKRLILTEQGKVALDYATQIFKMGSEMVEVLHDRIKPMRTDICIGALDSIPKQVILQLVQDASKIAPCQIKLVEGRSDEMLRELSAHRIDLFLTNSLPTLNERGGLFHRSIKKSPVSIFGAPKYKSLKKGFPRSIEGHPMIFPTYDSKLRYDLEHWGKVHEINFDIAIESQEIGIKKLVAIQAMGLIPAAHYTVQRQITAGELVEIGKLNGVNEELFLITASRKIENPISKRLMQDFKI